jgi:regulatory protein
LRRNKPPERNPLAAALEMLGRRAYSAAELRKKLEKKFPGSNEIPQTLARLRELGYLDDRRFAEHVAASLARQRRLGRYRARRELKARLVDYRTIEPALDRAYEAVSEQELLETTLEKKIKSMKLPPTRARLASLCQSLLRRGFRTDDIMKAVRSRPELKTVSEKVAVDDVSEI